MAVPADRLDAPSLVSARRALLAALQPVAPMSHAALDAFLGIVAPRTFRVTDWLLRGGERAAWCHFVVHGLVRELYVGDDGQEHTRTFVPEGQLTGSLLDLLSGKPSVTWIQALEPTQTLAWRYEDFDALCARFADLHVLARRTAESLYVRKTHREYEMLTLSAAERYARWRAEYPSLDARISRRLLASYLGVTPEHLSRLRRGATRRPRRPGRAP